MTDKAQALIEELVSACIAFGREREPDWQTRIEKARAALREYHAEVSGHIEEFEVLVSKLVDAAEPFITFRKIQTYNKPNTWDVQLLEKHLSNWDELVNILKARKPEVQE